MTSSSRSTGAADRAKPCGIHSLDTFALTVPKLSVAEEFFKTFGLDVRTQGKVLSLRTFGEDHTWGTISEGESKRLTHVSFGCFREDFDSLKDRLVSAGVELSVPPPSVNSDGIWFRDPDGLLVELKITHKTSPSQQTRHVVPSISSGKRGAPYRREAQIVRPTRLSHLLLFTANVPHAIDFYCSLLGLRLSDRTGDAIAFLHGIHGSDHHLIAFVKSDGPGLHHSSWDVLGVEDVGLGAMQMVDHGYDRGWGVGRHVLGSNHFYYAGDPWGSYAEYSANMDFVPKGKTWRAKDHLAEDGFYLWGPKPPEDFGVNYETAAGDSGTGVTVA